MADLPRGKIPDWVSRILAGTFLILAAAAVVPFWAVRDLPILQDHPSRFFEVWFTLKEAIPLQHTLMGWSPYASGGWPDLQFYPPGYVMLGVLLNWLTFQSLSTVELYRLLLFVILVLPGFSVLAFHRKLGTSWAPALFTALLIMLYRDPHYMGFDIRGGLEIGMLNARIAISLIPLVFLFLLSAQTSQHLKIAKLFVAGFFLGAMIFTHPWHFLPAASGVVLIFLCGMKENKETFSKTTAQSGAVFLMAMGIAAFWLLPAFAHREFMRRSIVNPFSIFTILGWLKGAAPYLFLYGMAVCGDGLGRKN